MKATVATAPLAIGVFEAANDSAPCDDVLTADEVAALLRVDRKTVYAAVKAGTLPALRLRHLIRFSRTAVLRSLLGSTDSRSSRKR